MNAVADVGKVTLALAGPPLLATLLRRWFFALGVSATNPCRCHQPHELSVGMPKLFASSDSGYHAEKAMSQ